MKIFAAVLMTVVILFCLPIRPLWVDEIYQLEGTLDQSYPQMVHNAMVAPGGMPLAYAAQKLWLDQVGFSAARALVPAAVFGLGTVLLLFFTARLLGLHAPLAAAFGFLLPLLFRYSTEARPYSQGLFFSALTTIVFLRWLSLPSPGKLSAYFLACLAAVYSQPFAVFIPCAHALYLLLWRRSRLVPVALVLAMTAACYLPWVLASRHALLSESWPHGMFFSFAQVSPFMLVREISGGGYFCSIALLILAVAGLRKPGTAILPLCVIVPVLLAIAADRWFNYFFAIRQLIFGLPPLILLATAGAAAWWQSHRALAVVLTGTLLTASLVKDIRWQADRHEDWEQAASTISIFLNQHPGCAAFLPPGDARHYYFFRPGLRNKTCSGPATMPALTVVSPYAPIEERQGLQHPWTVGDSTLRPGL